MLTVGLCAHLACLWEAAARKPGNVHPGCDFDDVCYMDFLSSAAVVAPVLETAPGRRVGEIILEGVRATRHVVATNTNLGILLLLGPLAAVLPGCDLRGGLTRVLDALDVADARSVYQAIRLAVPAGLGRVPEQDVRDEPTQTLREVMALAADRDLIARQYANGFQQVFDDGLSALRRGLDQAGALEPAIIACHLHLMAHHPDSLIARKRGQAEADEAARRARAVLDAGATAPAVAELDAWLRAEGHARNPGTTADLVTASLFVALREGMITLPLRFPWSAR
jgi:triphosphoribosyl-dephospho-CoA synthase